MDNIAINTTPFCGNLASQIGKNPVSIGQCGKCQMEPLGGGEESKCTKGGGIDVCTTPNSCGGDLICCANGECVKPGEEDEIGKFCS